MNLQKAMQAGMPAVGGGAVIGGSRDALEAAYSNQAQQQETELQYAARVASDSLAVLEKSVAELASRMQAVLTQDAPHPAVGDAKAQRAVSSPIANALLAHANQTDNITRNVQNLLNRIAL